MDEFDKGIDISLKGPEAEASVAEMRRQVDAWDLVMPPIEPLVLDFGLGEFRRTGLIESWVANELEEGYCGKFLFVFDGQTCPSHCHRQKHETFYVVRGHARMEYDGATREMAPGDVLSVEQGKYHAFTGIGPALLLEVSKPCRIDDNYFENRAIPIGGNCDARGGRRSTSYHASTASTCAAVTPDGHGSPWSTSAMQYRTLGRTGLKVSLMGMGTGGHDPLGQKSGRPESEMIRLLHRAFELGINVFDTSPGYGDGRSEELLGRALKELPRDEVVVLTKIPLAGGHTDDVRVMKSEEIAPAVEASLRRLGLETADVLLMAVAGPQYLDAIVDDHLPALEKLKQEGKVRFLGSSEQTRSDGAHEWLKRILPTGAIDVAMMGHNMLNQSAQRTVLPLCRERNIGVLNVFTVRNLFWNPPRLREVIAELKARGLLAADAVSDDDPLGWLLADGDAGSLVEAAYRYAAYTEGVTTVMCGTIDVGELEENVRTVSKGPLSADKVARLKATFGHLDEAIGN